MPPADPRLRPALDRALPADHLPGSTRVMDWPESRLVEFGSGEWRMVRIRARSKDLRGRDIVHVEWYIEGGAWQESYIADLTKMRKPG